MWPFWCGRSDCGSVALLVVAVLDCGRFDLLPTGMQVEEEEAGE